MKKIILIICLGFICISYSPKSFSQYTIHYNGGSGPQIPVTYNVSSNSLTIGNLPNPYNTPLRIDWYLPTNVYHQAVYPGETFESWGDYEFVISGSVWIQNSYPPYNMGYYASTSYYVWY